MSSLKALDALEVERAIIDPLSTRVHHYESSPTQEAFHQRFSIAEQRPYYSLITAGGRAGKTTAALVDLAWCLRGIHPYLPWQGPFTALVFCISRQQAAMVSAKKLFEACEFPSAIDRAALRLNPAHKPIYPLIASSPLIPAWELKSGRPDSINVGFRSIQHAKLVNGCEVFLSWSDIAETVNRVQGPKIGYIFLDENVGSRKLLIESRKRLMDSQHPGGWHGQLVWSGHGTQDNPAFDDYKSLCEDPANRDHEMFFINPGETGAVHQAAIDRQSATLTPEEREIHLYGTKSAGGLVRIFGKQWNESRHMLAADYVIQPEDNLWVGYDPGVAHPMGMVVDALTKAAPTKLHVVKCWVRTGGTIDEDIRMLAAWLDGRRLTGFVYDTNLKNHDRAGGPSVLTQFKDKMAAAGIVPMMGYWQSKKNHAPGISVMRTLFDQDLIAVNPSPESGGLLFRDEVLRYKGREETRFTGEGGIIKKNDALMDAQRYVAMQRPIWGEEFACGHARRSIMASIDDDLPPITPAELRQAKQVELSTLAARLRQRGRGRVRGFGEQSEVAVPLWMRRRDSGQT